MSGRTTGIVRNLDALGRIVVPIEFRRSLGLRDGAAMEISLVGGHVELRPFVPGCVFCGATRNLRTYKGRQVCEVCRVGIARA